MFGKIEARLYLLTLIPSLAMYVANTFLPIWVYDLSPGLSGLIIGAWYLVQVPAVMALLFVKVRVRTAILILLISLSMIGLSIPDANVIAVLRLIGGISSILYSVNLIALTIETTRVAGESERFYSILNFFNALPVILGPSLSSLILAYSGLSCTFIVSGAIMLLSIPLALGLNLQSGGEGRVNLAKVLQNWRIYALYFTEMFLFMTWFTLLPLKMRYLSLEELTGPLLSAEALIYTMMQLANYKVTPHLKSPRKVLVLLTLYSGLVACLFWFKDLTSTLMAVLSIPIVSGPITPVLYALNADLTERGEEQGASAMMSLVLKLGWGLGPIVSTQLFSTLYS